MPRGKRFFRHTVDIVTEQTVTNGSGGSKREWLPKPNTPPLKCLLDTPSSTDLVSAMQLQVTLDRTMYYKRGFVLGAKERIRWRNDETGKYEYYEQSGKPKDQGGQGRYNAIWLKLVM